MYNIVITNTIAEDKISINFDLQDGSLSLTSLDLSTSGDIELNPLVIKLAELIELNKKVEVVYEDSLELLKTDSKITLVKGALDEIYNSFNSNFTVEEDKLH
ncbi:hypothetical protein QLS91_16635 [Flavobacterium sp. LB2P84]|uniref:Uncharacterized protein n=1 Tax=Flavobacterium yafengii TaxID=3041253 RepID=A0AAW6TN23_9FLAO|nr:hypothetical protein [Flavobacterium yafengii]MDI5950204.1 hypothetical protein [Flavobacterium yafengii]MDI6034708.1 hypothetical protein [Flavobacterium yafengii]